MDSGDVCFVVRKNPKWIEAELEAIYQGASLVSLISSVNDLIIHERDTITGPFANLDEAEWFLKSVAIDNESWQVWTRSCNLYGLPNPAEKLHAGDSIYFDYIP